MLAELREKLDVFGHNMEKKAENV
jgi:hypothetical protein